MVSSPDVAAGESPLVADHLSERAARAALATDPDTEPLAHASFQVQPGGLSNLAWIATTATGRHFVRLSPPDPDRLGVDRDAECLLLRRVAAAGLAPPVVRCDPSQRLLVTRYVAGACWTRDAAREPRNIVRLALALRRLHALPVPAGQHRVDFAAQARHLERQVAAASRELPVLRAGVEPALARIRIQNRADTLCHNDLHHLNLVDEGDRLWLVDWEYGGAGDPVFDLASFVCQHDCGPHEVELLRTSYDDGRRISSDALDAACWLFDYVQWLWYRAWTGPGGEAAAVYRQRADQIGKRLVVAGR